MAVTVVDIIALRKGNAADKVFTTSTYMNAVCRMLEEHVGKVNDEKKGKTTTTI